MNVETEVREAEARIRMHIRATPLEPSPALGERSGLDFFLKLENVQRTGSFKVRGVMNRLLTLSPEERARGVITASTGNHGLAVAHGSNLLGIASTVCLPEGVPPHRIDALERLGPEIVVHGSECAETEAFAREEAARRGAVYVPPYNDTKIVGGHGTLAPEIVRELGRVDHVFVAVGGGGLIAGIGGYLKETGAEARVIGCLPANSPVMYDSVRAGRIVESRVLPTLSDATAGGIEPGAITFDLCRKYVDDWVLVEEDEIRAAMKLVFEEHRLVIEGAAGVAVAAFLKTAGSRAAGSPVALEGRNAVVLICGGNVDVAAFKKLVF